MADSTEYKQTTDEHIPKYHNENISSDKDTATHDQNLLLAATLVKDAAASRNMTFKTDERSIRLYNLYNHLAFKLALYVAVWCLLLLAIFEKPAVPGAALPYWATMIIEACILIFFLCRFIHNVLFAESASFWKDPKNIVVIVTIILVAVDMVGYIIWVNVSSPAVAVKAVRWSRPLRPLFLINFPEGRQLRKAFRNILRTLPDVVHILALFLASIAIFALLALKLMQNRSLVYPDGRPYFNNYFECVWDLYVLVTTANSPDVMMPAYNKNNWFAMFFFVYIVVNVYIFMNIVLASVYNNYRRHLKNEVIKTVYLKRRLLARVFDMLKVWQHDTYVVTRHTWHTLMETAAPHWGPTRRDVLFYVLDDTADNAIRRKDFLKVADLLNVELAEETEEPTALETWCPRCYLAPPSEVIKSIVRHRYFHYTFDFLILLNAFIVGFNLEQAEWGFLGAFTVEILLRVYTFGPKKYFTTFWDVFDFCVVMPAVIGTIIETSLGDDYGRVKLIDFLMVIRVLKLVRLIGSIKRFQIVLTTIVNIGPSIATYGAVIFVFFYIYAVIGMELFSGLINYYGYDTKNETEMFCGDHRLKGSEFLQKRYCGNNFNSIAHSFVILFELLVVNQWHVMSSGFVLVTNKAARLYFISFHMICVVILLNILTAFILEVFILEYSLSQTELESAIEARIKDMGLGLGQNPGANPKTAKQDKHVLVDNMEEVEMSGSSSTAATSGDSCDVSSDVTAGTAGKQQDQGLRFRLKRSSRKRVETLLEYMFEGEIGPAEDGDNEDVITVGPAARSNTSSEMAA